MLTQLINHHLIVLDKSTSMRTIAKAAGQMADKVVEGVAPISDQADQEYRMTVLLFGDPVNKLICTAYDRDVKRTPTTSRLYRADEVSTALNDAVAQGIDVLQQVPQTYGDHAFILTVITDGEENNSQSYPAPTRYGSGASLELRRKIAALPDNFTMTALVPGRGGVEWAKESGFYLDNIRQWETTQRGIEEVGRTILAATQTFTQARSLGTRSSTSYFTPNVAAVAQVAVSDPGAFNHISKDDYEMFGVVDKEQIKPFVERQTGRPYAVGSTYYQHTKRETIQARKRLAVRNVLSGELLTGNNVRSLLGLGPHTQMVDPDKVDPIYHLYVQSTSVNRNLIPGQSVIVLR